MDIIKTKNDFLQLINVSNGTLVSFKNECFESLILSGYSGLEIGKAIRFESCCFVGIVDFSQKKFKEEVIFIDCTFKSNAIFSSSHFYQNIYFYKSIFEKDALFDYTTFESFGQFAFSTFYSLCSFAFSVALKLLNFRGIKFISQKAQIDLYCSHFEKHANFSDCEIEFNNLFKENARENARIIKHHCLNTNDRVLALKYHKFEMNALLNKSNTLKTDKFILYLNRISNNHGDNWLRAIGFLLYTSVPLFILFYMFGISNPPYLWGWKSFDSFIKVVNEGFKYYLIILNPTHSFKDIGNLNPNLSGYLINTLSRIIISYAIYQILTAYRKHGRNI